MKKVFQEKLAFLRQQMEEKQVDKTKIDQVKPIKSQSQTQILKLRLSKLLNQNRNNYTIIEEYKKKMMAVEKEFEKMKDLTGIKDSNAIAD